MSLRRFLEVGAALDVAGRVAGADAVGRLAGAVRGAHQSHPAGRQDHRDVAVLHQLLGAFERDGLHPPDAAGRRAGPLRRLRHDLDRSGDAARRGRMRADDDGAARLQRDQHLIDRGGRRVGRRDDGRDDAERLGDLDDLPILDAVDHADGLHRPDELVDLSGGEQVLLDLVGDDAVAGLLDGQAGQRLGVGVTASAIAVTMRSICSWVSSARSGCAWRAARASARASAIDARSLSV